MSFDFLRTENVTELLMAATPFEWFVKLVGAVAGSLISIAYILPRGRREALLRLCVGIVTGLVFGGTAGAKMADTLGLLGKISATEISLIGATLASLCAWWGLGILQRIAERMPMRLSKTPASQNSTGGDKQ